MRKESQKGSITIFLSIILLAMVLVAGVIVDGARINTAKPQIKRALETSIRSALAGYNMDLKEKYGLFALNQNDKVHLEEIIKDYLNKNLMIDKEELDDKNISNYLNLYDYKIESIEVKPIFNLCENPVTRQQILEYMKYRGPKEIGKEFINKLELLKKAGPTSEAYKKRIDFEKELKNIEKFQRQVYKNIYGEYEKKIMWSYKREKMDYYVRGFNEKVFRSIINEYIEEILNYKDLKNSLKDVKKEIDKAKTAKKKEELREKRRKIQRKIEAAHENIEDKYEKILKDMDEYETINKKAVDSIVELAENSKAVRLSLEKYKDELSKNQSQIMTEALEDLKAQAEDYDRQISYAEKGSKGNSLNKIKNELNENIEVLNGRNSSSIINLIEEISPNTAKKLESKKLKRLGSSIIARIKSYNNDIQYDYLLKERDNNYKQYDNRKVIQKGSNDKIKVNGNQGDNTAVIGDKEYSMLPSVTITGPKKDIIESGIQFLWKVDDDKRIQNIEFLEDRGQGFSELALSNLNLITKNIDLENIIDEIYINEYIIGTFKSYVSEASREHNLRHIEKSSQDSYFKASEVEYILNGRKSEKINQILTDSKMLLTRFPLNSIHAFTCKGKNAIATSTAAAVAGWYTGGTGIPIIRTLILLSWSMKESIHDLEELKSGREVVLYKTERDWATSLKRNIEKTSNKEGENTDLKTSGKKRDLLSTSYKDYLRFFLLVQNKDDTMKGIQDLIQLNMQKSTGKSDLKLEDFNTYIKIKAVVSIKYLFMSQNFMPREAKMKNKRHNFKVEIYQGY